MNRQVKMMGGQPSDRTVIALGVPLAQKHILNPQDAVGDGVV